MYTVFLHQELECSPSYFSAQFWQRIWIKCKINSQEKAYLQSTELKKEFHCLRLDQTPFVLIMKDQ